jgi:dUTP pyrophosphatase
MIKYYNSGDYAPTVGTEGSAGLDLYINSLARDAPFSYSIGTGIHVEIPKGWVGLLVPRSSFGSRGYTLKNTIGIIDSDYRGEILLKIKRDSSLGVDPVGLSEGDKVAQLVVVRCNTAAQQVNSLEDLTVTERGDGGFGSTGGA